MYPTGLYALLPFAVSYEPYTASHVTAQLQLLLFSALAFSVLMRTGIYPPELSSINLDSDWIYRRLLRKLWGVSQSMLTAARTAVEFNLGAMATRLNAGIYRHHGPGGGRARTWSTRGMALWMLVILFGYLVLYYV